MLFSGVNICNCYNGVLVKGGPVLSSGGSTGGQIAFLGGASGFGQNMWETQKNGKLIAQGMWYEADIDIYKKFYRSDRSLFRFTGNRRDELGLCLRIRIGLLSL